MRHGSACGRVAACTAIALLSFASVAEAQTSFRPPRSISSRVTHDAFRTRTAVRNLALLPAEAAPQPSWLAQLSFGYSDDGDSIKSVTPAAELELDVGASTFLLDWDLYDRVHSDGETKEGTGDPSLTALHKLDLDKLNWVIGGAGVTVPSGSELRSSHATQSLAAIYGHDLKNDRLVADWLKDGWTELWVTSDHQKQSDGHASPWTWTGKAYYYHRIDGSDGKDVFAVLTYSYQRDGGHATSVGMGTEFPVKDVSVSIAGTCALNAPQSCGTIELSFRWKL